MQSLHRRFKISACRPFPMMVAAAVLWLGTISLAEEKPVTGEAVYKAKCASCHGSKGEGKSDSYPNPLVGDRSIGELTEYISKTMPEDKPGTCVGDEASQVAKYIHETFYSSTAQARNKPARVELSRLTVRQYRNTVADLVGWFRGPGHIDGRQGLNAHYYKTRNPWGNDRAIERIDPIVAFDFRDQSPDSDQLDGATMEPYEFSIRWEGSVYAPDTGEYEFVVRTDQATRFWINDLKRPLVDAYVKSGTDTEHRGSIFLLGGRYYPIRLEFSKASQGVKDEKVKQKPPAQASVFLEWQRPSLLREVIPARYLQPGHSKEVCIVSTHFPPDDRSFGWERATTISKDWDQAATEAAIEVTGYISSHLDELAATKRDAGDRGTKIKEFCGRVAELAFRRPLSDDLRNRYVEGPFAKTPDVEEAAKRVMLMLFKSPRFLYRELGSTDPNSNDPFNVASRISYTVWDSTPDPTLWKAAQDNQLNTREQVAAHAQRMIADVRYRSKLREFLLRWLKIDRVADLSKDPEKYGEFTPAVANDLRASLEIFIDEFIASDASDFRQLLLSDSIYLNGRLARFYGADLPEDAAFQKMNLEPTERAGVFSHPYLLADFAYTGTSSPIHRGIFIARSVLGRTLRPPPEAVAPVSPQLQPDLTTRERVALQTQAESCQSCHALINPLGFTLEHFDAVGRFRENENGKSIDANGIYRTRQGDTVQFNGARSLANFLADSPETHGAFVEQLFHGMVKQSMRAYGSQTRESLRDVFAKENFSIRKLAVEIVATSALTTSDAKSQTVAEVQK